MNFWLKVAIGCFLFDTFLIILYLADIKKEIERLKWTLFEIDKNIDKNLTRLCNIQQNFFIYVSEYLKDKK